MHRSRRILQLLLGVLTLATLVLLLLRLDLLLPLLCKEDLTIRLILLVATHQFVELLLRILDLGHQVLRRIPREPGTHLADVEVVLGILALEDLGHHLGLLHRRKATTNLDATYIGLELDLVVVLLLRLLLVLEKEDLVLLLNVGLPNLLVTHLAELLGILQEVVNLEAVLLREERHEVLETLDLPIVVLELHELTEKEALLVGNHLLGRNEGHNAILLGGDLRILIEIINGNARIINLGESGHFVELGALFESPFYADVQMYDLLTSAILFVILTPGVVLTLPPSGGVTAAIVHAVVFYVIQAFLAQYIPWWAIWVAGVLIVGGRLWAARPATPTY